MVYRPTVRYADAFKYYVDSIFHSTRLDRNQIIRLALFTAAHSETYKNIIEKYKIADVSLPHPEWKLSEDEYWKEQNYTKPITKQPTLYLEQDGILIKIG